ncbi:MAG: hypothetical protein HQRvContig05_7 [Haloquadratum phage sp.]|nr:MAG: hypothetical protein HQRvContig05_7 [Haloquadratum phage sp.]
MSDVQTIHENDERGEQVTRRVVTVTDATGDEYEHVFRETDGGHQYEGDGDAPDSAREALEEYLNE